MASEKEMKERLDTLRAEHAEREKAVDQIRKLIEKAEDKRRRRPEASRHYDEIIDNLELSLREMKLLANKAEREIAAAEREIEEARQNACPVDAVRNGAGSARGEGPEPRAKTESDAPPLSTTPADAAKRIIDTPVNAITKLPLQEIALGNIHLNTGKAENRNDEAARKLAGRIELHRQLQPHETKRRSLLKKRSLIEQRKQRLLRDAITKVVKHDAASLTGDELELVKASHDLLAKALDPTPEQTRILELIERVLPEIEEHLGKLRGT